MIQIILLIIMVLGDLNFTGGRFLTEFEKQDYNADFPFSQVQHELRGADIVIANLEGPLSLAEWSKEAFSKEWRFRQLPVFAGSIRNAGIDVLLLGNNHIADTGPEGIDETLKVITDTGMQWVPPPEQGPLVISKGGLTIEIWNADIFSPPHTDPWVTRVDTLMRLIQKTRKEKDPPDLSMALLHAHQGTTQANDLESIAAQLQKAGVQWIIFGGDHTPASMTVNKHGGIHYGLGDFIFGCDCSGETKGKVLSLRIEKGKIQPRELMILTGSNANGYKARFDPMHD